MILEPFQQRGEVDADARPRDSLAEREILTGALENHPDFLATSPSFILARFTLSDESGHPATVSLVNKLLMRTKRTNIFQGPIDIPHSTVGSIDPFPTGD